ncbi:MAG: aldo/keto reductase [Candidatus Thorarchaeota archaeon]
MEKMTLPQIGLGTMLGNSIDAQKAFTEAINIGFRFIDTAQIYFNEKTVGKAITAANIPREEIVLATKLWITNFRPRKLLKSVNKSLERLNLEYIDILYLHWPWRFNKINESLKTMDKLIEEGKIKHIAVSNFTEKQVEEAQTYTKNHIVANQVEMHPWFPQKRMLEFLTKNKMHLVGYFPLMHGRFNQVPELLQIAKKHNTNAAQVSLAWIISKNAVPIPKSANVKHLQDNFDSLKLRLDSEDIKLIDSITTRKRFANITLLQPEWKKEKE